MPTPQIKEDREKKKENKDGKKRVTMRISMHLYKIIIYLWLVNKENRYKF